MAGVLSNLGKNKPKIQEAEWIINSINPKKSMWRYILWLNLWKLKAERIMKAARGKQCFTYCGKIIWITADLSSEARVQKEVAQHFQGPKEKKCQVRILYQTKTYSRNEGEINIFSDEEKLG